MNIGSRNTGLHLKQGSLSTMNAVKALDLYAQTGNADPRFAMYNKDAIKNHLEKRRGGRRAQSNIRPRQRFSTINIFHKNDIAAVSNHQPEEGIAVANSSKCFRQVREPDPVSASQLGCVVTTTLCLSRQEAPELDCLLVCQRQPHAGAEGHQNEIFPHIGLQFGTCLLHPVPALPRPALSRQDAETLGAGSLLKQSKTRPCLASDDDAPE